MTDGHCMLCLWHDTRPEDASQTKRQKVWLGGGGAINRAASPAASLPPRHCFGAVPTPLPGILCEYQTLGIWSVKDLSESKIIKLPSKFPRKNLLETLAILKISFRVWHTCLFSCHSDFTSVRFLGMMTTHVL